MAEAATDLADPAARVELAGQAGQAAPDPVGPAVRAITGPADLVARVTTDLAAQADPVDRATTDLADPVTTDPAVPAARRSGAWHGDDHRGYFHSAPWGDGPAPWGAGEPPRPSWDRPLPPPGGPWNYGPINYWGYQETPFWNPQFNQFGFNFFGVWIPL